MSSPIKLFTDKHQLALNGLDSPFGKLLLEWLASRADYYNLALRTGTDITTLARAQGALEPIETLRGLRAELIKFSKDIAAGKVTKEVITHAVAPI